MEMHEQMAGGKEIEWVEMLQEQPRDLLTCDAR
jgi:hypothetical protein